MTGEDPGPDELTVGAVIEDCAPVIRRLARGRYGIAISGSVGKGTFDKHSDLDFRLYCDETLSPPERWQEARGAFVEKMATWKERGIHVDDCWVRSIKDVDEELSRWTAGEATPQDLPWTIWGYHLLPDIYHQRIVEDPSGVLAAWKDRLRVYPAGLKQAILDKHLGSLRYWGQDYHYENKVRRGDVVFLAGISARLVHDLMQVVFALNEVYFVGDGNNIEFASTFKQAPGDFAQRVRSVLYPAHSADMFAQQREAALGLIADVETLAERVGRIVSGKRNESIRGN